VDLRKCGVSHYARDPSAEVLMCAYAFDDGPVLQWVPAEGEPMPHDLHDAIRDPAVIKSAWNAVFEQNIWAHVLGIETPWDAWQCTMVLAMTLSLPGSLAQAGEVVGLPAEKAKLAEGKRLVKLFCAPRKPTKMKPHVRATRETDSEKWEDFKRYNIRDVEAERAIWRRLRTWALSPEEHANWVLDCEINARGLPVNMRAVDGALEIYGAIVQDRLAKMREITGLDNPNSGAQLLPWLRDRGYPYADLVKGHVKKASGLSYADNGTKAVLEYRSEIAKASVKKFDALKRATDSDNRLRFHYQFWGAQRTGRTAGRVFAPQNLPRPPDYLEDKHKQAALVDDLETCTPLGFEWLYSNPMEALSTAVRPVIEAPAGRTFVSADLNAIENRGIGYLANEEKILNVFREGRCPYLDFASQFYQRPYAELYEEYKPKDGSKGDKSKRKFCKPSTLGCGYRLSAGEIREDPRTGEEIATGLLGYAWAMGVMLTQEDAIKSVDVWRATFPGVCDYWDELEKAFKHTIRTGRPSRARRLSFDRAGPFVRMVLPSGGFRYYCRPKIEPVKTPWGQVRGTITYEGLNIKKQWVRLSTHGGKILENGCQSFCRDILYYGAQMCRKRGIDMRLTVYDEINALSSTEDADEKLAVLIECMTTPPPWAPDFPMGAAGGHFPHYIKD
jgi:DNA polymerase